jgi:hypothetical protein
MMHQNDRQTWGYEICEKNENLWFGKSRQVQVGSKNVKISIVGIFCSLTSATPRIPEYFFLHHL